MKIKFLILLITAFFLISTAKAQTGKLIKTYSDKVELQKIIIKAYGLVLIWQVDEKLSENVKRLENDLTERAINTRMNSIYSLYETEGGDLEIVKNENLISTSEFVKKELTKFKSIDDKLSYLAANGIMTEISIYLNKEGTEEFLTNYYSNLNKIAQDLIDKGKIEKSGSPDHMLYIAQQEAYKLDLIKPLVPEIYQQNSILKDYNSKQLKEAIMDGAIWGKISNAFWESPAVKKANKSNETENESDKNSDTVKFLIDPDGKYTFRYSNPYKMHISKVFMRFDESNFNKREYEVNYDNKTGQIILSDSKDITAIVANILDGFSYNFHMIDIDGNRSVALEEGLKSKIRDFFIEYVNPGLLFKLGNSYYSSDRTAKVSLDKETLILRTINNEFNLDMSYLINDDGNILIGKSSNYDGTPYAICRIFRLGKKYTLEYKVVESNRKYNAKLGKTVKNNKVIETGIINLM